MKQLKSILFTLIPFIFLLLNACNFQTSTDVSISDAWVRKNAPGQTIGAAYMSFNSPKKSTLVYVEAIDTAGAVEIHSMTMHNGVMKMRMLEELVLAPNKTIALKPGDYHLMLFDLKTPLKTGKSVTFRLCFKDENGKITEQTVTAPVKEL